MPEAELAKVGSFKVVTSPVLASESGIIHGFGTKKQGGSRSRTPASFSNPFTSSGAFDTKASSVAELVKDAGFAAKNVLFPKQVHGNRVLVFDQMPADMDEVRRTEADAIISTVPGLMIGVMTADCLPILFYDPHRQVVAAVHAGWRGTLNMIARRTMEILVKDFRCEPGSLLVALGPSISGQSFEIDEPLLNQFRQAFEYWSRYARPQRQAKWLMDFRMINAHMLALMGLEEKNFWVSGQCTYLEKDLFWSYRRDGEQAGRMFNFIGLKPVRHRS